MEKIPVRLIKITEVVHDTHMPLMITVPRIDDAPKCFMIVGHGTFLG
jgi:hypothetical protein